MSELISEKSGEKVSEKLQRILQEVIKAGASDLHLTVSVPPVLRVSGDLRPLEGYDPLNNQAVAELIFGLLSDDQKELLKVNKELDFSFSFTDRGRFRVNVYHQKGYLAAALRSIPFTVPSIADLNLPNILYELSELPQGFVLVTGSAGQGKSTTLAALINHINENRSVHIITIEDPIEYVFANKKALIEQREMYLDTNSWSVALRSVLREDPNVVLVGEMRDYETIAAAITIAETGHLVLATLHTNSAAQTIDRIIDVFPDQQQQQVRTQLSSILEGVICQRLVRAKAGGRLPAVEILLPNSAVRNTIREGKTHQLDNIIATSLDIGMMSMERSLAGLVNSGQVDLEEARSQTLRSAELGRLIKGGVIRSQAKEEK